MAKGRTQFKRFYKKIAGAFDAPLDVFDEYAEDPLESIRNEMTLLSTLTYCEEPLNLWNLMCVSSVPSEPIVQMIVNMIQYGQKMPLIGCMSDAGKPWIATTMHPVADRSVGRITIPLGIGAVSFYTLPTFIKLYAGKDGVAETD